MKKGIVTSLAALLFAACGGAAAARHDEVVARRTAAPPPVARPRPPATSGDDLGNASCQVSPVYFPFESADLTTETRDTLVRDAHCIEAHPEQPVQLVGATDPRGTEEYNLALGDRRARSVASYLESLGVPAARIHVTSVGEEQSRGADERSWAEDRWVKDR